MPHSVSRIALSFVVFASGALACSQSAGSGDEAITSVESTAQTLRGSRAPSARPSRVHDVLLVHGAWADGSCWSSVIAILQRDGFTVQAVQLREQSLADDAALVRHALAGIPGPVVVAGHSYGGFVMSEATTGASNVAGLVFVAAFAPEQGETIVGLGSGYPPAPALLNLVVDDQGFATIEADRFVQHFAAGVPRSHARVLATVQQRVSLTLLQTQAGPPGWKAFPTYFQVSANDEAIDPDLERLFARRMGAETIELHAGHLSMISHPRPVAELIERAAGE